MSTRRFEQDHETDTLDATTEAAVLAAQAPTDARHRKHADGEDKLSLFWRVFGGTILSIVALVGITIYNNLSTSISELRSELSRVNEARAELVKKEEFNARTQNVWDRVQSLQDLKVMVTAREAQLKVADDERRDLAKQLQDLRERLAKVEGATEVKPMAKGPAGKGE